MFGLPMHPTAILDNQLAKMRASEIVSRANLRSSRKRHFLVPNGSD